MLSTIRRCPRLAQTFCKSSNYCNSRCTTLTLFSIEEDQRLIKLHAEYTSSAETSPSRVFVIHRVLLCYFSKYFKNALEGAFEEAGKGIFSLFETSQRTLEMFVSWLYTGTLWHRNTRSHGEGYANRQTEYTSTGYSCALHNDIEPGCNHCEHDLVDLYDPAEYFDVRPLGGHIVLELQFANVNDSSPFDISAALLAYSKLPLTSPLCRFVTASIPVGWPTYVQTVQDREILEEFIEQLPTPVLAGIATRLPYSDCSKRAFTARLGGPEDPKVAYRDVTFKPHALHKHCGDHEEDVCERRTEFEAIELL